MFFALVLYRTQHIVGIVVLQLYSFYNSWGHVAVIGKNCDWLMECGVNVSVTLRVLYTLTGNWLLQAPKKAIILSVIQAKGEYTHIFWLKHAYIHTQLAQSKVLAVL